MAHHLRIALYDMTSGKVEEAVEIARKGMIPLYEAQPGFIRYEVGTLDDGGVVSFSVWETGDEAQPRHRARSRVGQGEPRGPHQAP